MLYTHLLPQKKLTGNDSHFASEVNTVIKATNFQADSSVLKEIFFGTSNRTDMYLAKNSFVGDIIAKDGPESFMSLAEATAKLALITNNSTTVPIYVKIRDFSSFDFDADVFDFVPGKFPFIVDGETVFDEPLTVSTANLKIMPGQREWIPYCLSLFVAIYTESSTANVSVVIFGKS